MDRVPDRLVPGQLERVRSELPVVRVEAVVRLERAGDGLEVVPVAREPGQLVARVRAAARSSATPDARNNISGFRCAVSTLPEAP